MKPPFRLIRFPRVSEDTVECLEAMLERARRGEIIGIAYAAMQSNRKFFYNSCGEAHRNPTFAAGMTQAMLHGLMRKVHNEEE
jgi:hypothetical protein